MDDENEEKNRFRPTEMMKKLFAAGVGTFFLTEESLRSLLVDFKLPKELLANLLESANKTRKEFMQNISQEVLNKVSEKVDLAAFISEVLSKNEIKLEVKVRLDPKTPDKKST
jgi:hypothetical protein